MDIIKLFFTELEPFAFLLKFFVVTCSLYIHTYKCFIVLLLVIIFNAYMFFLYIYMLVLLLLLLLLQIMEYAAVS